MEITDDFKNEILTNSKAIESIEVFYKKKEKFKGQLAFVKDDPFEIKIFDKSNKADEAEHLIYFGRAEEITLNYFDGTVKVFKDSID
ncbi:hypothetical protein [Chryseobacterium terrae]|uniref:Uncharacterized protein n=1 Tax=Chryseobacterium terrae TaxID=3163299 RepID=A0ABW8Y0Z1_9FLAO